MALYKTIGCDVIEKVSNWKNEWSEISLAIVKLKCKLKELLKATMAKGQLMWYHTCGMFITTENAIINWIRVSPACKWSVF